MGAFLLLAAIPALIIYVIGAPGRDGINFLKAFIGYPCAGFAAFSLLITPWDITTLKMLALLGIPAFLAFLPGWLIKK